MRARTLAGALPMLVVCSAAAGCSTQLDAPDSTFADASASKVACIDCGVEMADYLTPPHPLPHVRFGAAVALSGTRLAVSAAYENASGKPDDPEGALQSYVPPGEGVTYLYDLAKPALGPLRIVVPHADPEDGQVSTEQLHMFPADNQPELNLAIDGEYLIIGAAGEDSGLVPGDDVDVETAQANNGAEQAGAVYVYALADLDRGKIKPRQYLKAPDVAAGDLFGASVALSGAHLVIGAPGKDSSNADDPMDDDPADTGAVYVYELDHGSFVFQKKLKPAGLRKNDFFGISVAADADFLVAGAWASTVDMGGDTPAKRSGAAYVYRWDAAGPMLDARLEPDIAAEYGGFGEVVRVAHQRIVVSNPLASQCADDTHKFRFRGAAYVFRHNAGEWKLEHCFGPGDRVAEDFFGYSSLGFSGDLLLVGAGWDDSGRVGDPSDRGLKYAGAAYLEALDDTRWRQRAYLKAPNLALHDVFGASVALDSNRIVVGAPQRSRTERGQSGPVYGGAVYVFDVDLASSGQ